MIEAQWDELVQLAASVKSGKVTATTVLKRFGSVATGDPFYRAGKALGRLERSLFLCDLLTSKDFRRELGVYGLYMHKVPLRNSIYFNWLKIKLR